MESKEFLEKNGIHPVMTTRVTQNYLIQLLDEYSQQREIAAYNQALEDVRKNGCSIYEDNGIDIKAIEIPIDNFLSLKKQ